MGVEGARTAKDCGLILFFPSFSVSYYCDSYSFPFYCTFGDSTLPNWLGVTRLGQKCSDLTSCTLQSWEDSPLYQENSKACCIHPGSLGQIFSVARGPHRSGSPQRLAALLLQTSHCLPEDCAKYFSCWRAYIDGKSYQELVPN